jgi:transcriptional regulator with GAF, ATPase, and Fis domain
LKNLRQNENACLNKVDSQNIFDEMIGRSEPLLHVFSQVEQVANMSVTVLLLGETGTGKGIIARIIYRCSARKDMPLITINCAALPTKRIECELCGQREGAISEADHRLIGLLDQADGCTIFLDEIETLPLDLQCKLLRIIQDGEFERPGSPHTSKIDVRIIAASNRNLAEEVQAGRFRQDLYDRLNLFSITIPPLRERKDDIPLLVNYFIAKFSRRSGKKIVTVAKATLNALQDYHWPGNLWELESVIERAIISSRGGKLQILEHFKVLHRDTAQDKAEVKTFADLERDHILTTLAKTAWRIEGDKGAALLLGLNPSTLRARIRKLGIQRP